MSATASVRNKFYSERDVIDESASDYYGALAEQKQQVDEENARESIIRGINPRTGKQLTLEEHQGALLRINASLDEIQPYVRRREQQRAQQIADEQELACWAESQYPCTSCTQVRNADYDSLNPAQQMLADLTS